MSRAINIYELFDVMYTNRIIMIYQGHFDQEMVRSIMSMTEKKFISDDTEEAIRKKVFNVMIEGLQNICKHQVKLLEGKDNSLLVLGKEEDGYKIITGNLIDNASIEKLSSKLNFINNLTKDELKEYYKKMRLQSVISEVGGAGLGFIDMVRKSGNPLEFRFYDVNDQYSFFVLLNKVNSN